MEDRRKLKKLVEIMGEQIKIKGNDWLVTEILETIGEVTSTDNISKHSVIQSINEYCIEDRIKNQGQDFYQSFPIISLKEQLVNDFIKMEHERRRDDFENFCLCMYQQIENITNYLFDNKIEANWRTKQNMVAVKSFYDSNLKKYIKPTTGKTLHELIFQRSSDTKWYANRKFKAVLFFFYFDQDIKQNDYVFNSISNVFDEIYQVRNQNHRGVSSSGFKRDIIDRIKGKESKYYFKFYGFLEDFISKIELSKSIMPKAEQKYAKPIQKKVEKNTLGANSTELQNLKERMEKGN